MEQHVCMSSWKVLNAKRRRKRKMGRHELAKARRAAVDKETGASTDYEMDGVTTSEPED